MLKRNLIIIAIASLALVLTSNAFGQRKNRKAKVDRPTTSSSSLQKTQVKKPTKIITETTIPVKAPTTSNRSPRKWNSPDLDADKNSVKTNQPPTSGISQTPRRQQYNPKEYSIEKLKNSKKPPVQATQPNNYIGETEKNIKKPTTQRRQNNRPSTTAPTNSLIIIPTEVPNIKTRSREER